MTTKDKDLEARVRRLEDIEAIRKLTIRLLFLYPTLAGRRVNRALFKERLYRHGERRDFIRRGRVKLFFRFFQPFTILP